MADTTPTPATFCYQCGKRVNRQVETCWFCGAPTRRWIRTPKRCPYCGENVRAEAVKCRHCGEFIDGRPRQEAPVRQQIVFVVDRNLLQRVQGVRVDQDFRLVAGEPVPQNVARVLDAQTVRAIETGQPRLIAQAGVHALPAPEAAGAAGPGVIDVEPLAGPPAAHSGRALPAPEGGTASANLPALRGDNTPVPSTPGSAAAGLGKALVKAGASVGGALIKRMFQPPAPEQKEVTIPAGAPEQYRICVRCQSEILASDNFCYNCGTQYHEARIDQMIPMSLKGGRPRLRIGQFLIILVLIAASVVLKLKVIPAAESYSAIGSLATAGLAALVSLFGLLLGPGILNRFLSLVLGGIATAALLFMQ